jgi:hypothetical protein
MHKLLQIVGEYFIGSGSRKFFREQRNFILEYEQNPCDLEAFLEEITSKETSFMLRRKIIPNILTGGAIAFSIGMRDQSYLLFALIGEGLRLSDMSDKDQKYVQECLDVREAYREEQVTDYPWLPKKSSNWLE